MLKGEVSNQEDIEMFTFLKKKVTPEKFASDIWSTFVQIMQHELDNSNKHDRKAFKAEHGWDYDKIRYIVEFPFLFVFLIYNEVENYFPEKKTEIMKEFIEILEKNDMSFLLHPRRDYSVAWHDALTRRLDIEDESTLNNPIYCASKLASIRCFGEEKGLDIRNIIMFSSHINSFIGMLNENFKRYKVV